MLFMRKIYPNSSLISKQIRGIKADHVKVLLLRDEKVYPLMQVETFVQGDIVVAFGECENKDEIEQWIYTL